VKHSQQLLQFLSVVVAVVRVQSVLMLLEALLVLAVQAHHQASLVLQ
jgi:hypothetical protein